MRTTPSWIKNPPTNIKDQLTLLKDQRRFLKSDGPRGRFLRRLLSSIEDFQAIAEAEAKEYDPLAFFRPSYEQALLLNAWMWGISFLCVYSANRIGKTTACFINFLLWLFPNNPKWKVFQPYTEDPTQFAPNHKPRFVQVFPRPNIKALKLITRALRRAPQSLPKPNPRLSLAESEDNRKVLQWLQNEVPEAFKPAWPNQPWDKGGTAWFGAPTQPHHEQIMFPLWKSWIPKYYLDRYVPSSREISLKITSPSGRLTAWEIVGKSYQSEDTVWASGAVDAILLTEGITPAILSEVKLRFKDPGIGSHDFTPYEPANSGAASALAQRIDKGTEPLPLKHFVFKKFRVYDAPEHIITEEKRQGLIDSYQGTKEGKARLDGDFFASSMLVLAHLSRDIHLLDMSWGEVKERWPDGLIYRGVDPGMDHPTACVWAYLLRTNVWIIYRAWSQAGLSISERVKEIIRLSHNKRIKHQWGKGPNDFYCVETHPSPDSEIVTLTPIDFHIFKEDETTGLPYSLNYILAGLPVVESIHTGPEERSQMFDEALTPSQFVPHILTNKPPGPRVYFLKNEPGVMAFFLKMEEFYWDRKKSGEDRGAPKDKIPIHGDDELDAACYAISTPYRWTKVRPRARLAQDSEPDQDLIQASRRNQGRIITPDDDDFATVAKPNSRERKLFGDVREISEEVGFDINRY